MELSNAKYFSLPSTNYVLFRKKHNILLDPKLDIWDMDSNLENTMYFVL